MKEVRIKLHDTPITAIAKMSDGNPGALTAMMVLMKEGEKIDPDDFMGGFGKILTLDSHGIYGTDIYILFSDICDRNPARTIAVLRAVQLGFFSESILVDACGRQDYSGRDMVDVKDLYQQVKERLPNFDPENIADYPEVIELLTFDGKDELIVGDAGDAGIEDPEEKNEES